MGEVIGPAEGRDHARRQARATSRRQCTLRFDGRPTGSTDVDDGSSFGARTAFRAVDSWGEP